MRTWALLALAVVLAAASGLAAGEPPRFDSAWSPAASRIILLERPAEPVRDEEGIVRSLIDDVPLGRSITVRADFAWGEILVFDSSPVPGTQRQVAKKLIQEIPVDGPVSALSVADFDGDGREDVAAADFLAGRVLVYLTGEGGKLEQSSRVEVGAGPVRMAVGDFDGDGNSDLATANIIDQSISIARGQGGGKMAEPVTRRLAAAALPFKLTTAAAVDYTNLKNAITTTAMGGTTRGKLQKLVDKSERSYNRADTRHAISNLEKLIREVKRATDISSTGRATLRALAADLIKALLGGGGNGDVTVAMTANPSVMAPGGTATLTWSSSGATTAWINNGVGSVATSGSMTVSPAASTTYTIVATGPNGSASASATVSVGVAGTVYVNASTGSDLAGDGSAGKPYRSITKALSVATSGKVVSVASGIHDADLETFPLTIPDGVSVVGAGSTITQILGGGNSGYGHVAMIMGNNTSLAGVRVQNVGGVNIYTDGTAAISSCLITSSKTYGIQIDSAGTATVTGTQFSGTKSFAVLLLGQMTMSGCTITGAGTDGIEANGSSRLDLTTTQITGSTWDAVWFQETASGTVTSNTLNDNGLRAVAAYYVPGPIGVINMSSNTITGNGGGTAFTPTRAQIYLAGAPGSILGGNTITGDASTQFGAWLNGITSATVTGNTLNSTANPASSYSVYWMGGSTGTLSSNVFTGGARAVRASTATSNVSATGNTITGPITGFLVTGGTGTYRSNSVTGCTPAASFARGVYITGGTPDFGTLASPGGNVFLNLATGCNNMRNATGPAIEARGNTWNNAVPTVCGGCGCDIRGTVNP